MTELVARAMSECHLYMDLHPCPQCGEQEFSWSTHQAGIRDGQKTSSYEGRCPTCGATRRFEFIVLDPNIPPPALGGPEPSQIIDPAEFLAVGDHAWRLAAVPANATPDEIADAYDAAVDAVAAVEEILKFIPPDATVVPETAFRTPEGMARLAANPMRFSRRTLEAVLVDRRQVLAEVSRHMDAVDWDAVD